MRILIFGTGKYYHRYKALFEDMEIIALLDNDAQKQGKMLDGIRTVSPKEGIKGDFDRIYILLADDVDACYQLISLGVPREKIYDKRDWEHLVYRRDWRYYPAPMKYRRTNGKKILLISYGFSYTGAPLALVSMGTVLAKQGYNVTMSADGGNEDFRQMLVKQGINTIIDSNLRYSRLCYLTWTREFDLIVINTVCLYYLLFRRDTEQPVIWWIHEPKMYYADIPKQAFTFIADHHNNLSVYAISQRALNNFQEKCDRISIGQLLYGLDDLRMDRSIDSNKKIFAVIGNVIPLKGTDIFIKAAIKLLDKGFNDVQFWVIGDISSDFAQHIKQEVQEERNIKFLGEIPHPEMKRVYSEITALFVPSKEETMSMVATESMMNCRACVVSRNTGISHYVSDGISGFVCDAEDISAWVEKMEWIIYHLKEWEQMGQRARKIYDEYFSMDTFEKNITAILNTSLR